MTYKGIREYRAITLTTAAGENVVGTAGNDTFNAVAVATTPAEGTLNVGDQIDGGAGTDTLNITVANNAAGGAAAAALAAGVSIKNVEIINFTIADQVPNAAALTSSTYSGIQQLWQIDNTAAGVPTFGNVIVGSGVTAGFRSTNDFNTAVAANVTVTAASTSQTTIAAALDGVATASSITFADSGAATSLRTLEVSGKVAAAAVGNTGNLTITGTATAETLKLSMTSAVDLTAVAGFGAGLKTIDASASTGAIRADGGSGSTAITTTANLQTVELGSGGDRVTLDVAAATKELTVDAGAGNDTITITGTLVAANTDASVAVTLGEGKDTVNAAGVVTGGVSAFVNLGNIALAAADQTLAQLTEQLVTITDFKTSEDILSLGGTGVALNEGQLISIAGAADLLAATKAAAAITNGAGALATASKSVAFNFGGDAYVFVDNTAGADIAATDGLVKLVGVDATELSNVQNGNFVL